MILHASGFAPADKATDTRLIQGYLGHRFIHYTVRYAAKNPARFEKLWRKREIRRWLEVIILRKPYLLSVISNENPTRMEFG
jgi:hypothetical protein